MLKKIRVFDLQAGMYVVDTGLSWLDHPYLYSVEGVVETDENIRAIRSEGFAEVFIETDADARKTESSRVYERADVERAMAEALKSTFDENKSNKAVPLAEELRVAGKTHLRAMDTLKYAMEAAASKVPLNANACQDAGRDIAASVARNRDALICITRLHDTGSYHNRHGVGVSCLAAAFGDYLGLDRVQVAELAVAGLLHDVGKALSPRDLLDKPDKLSTEEFARLKRHPIESCVVVAGSMSVSPHVLRGISEHHERFDGSGYPRGLKGSEQSFHGRILAIADVFDALTQDRPYKERMLPDKAMSVLFAMRDKDFERGLLERFVKCVGVYPAGSLVRLTSGEHAVVCESNPGFPLRPKVVVVFDNEMAPIHPVRMDLSGKEGPAPAKPVEVDTLVDHRPHGVLAGDHLL